MKNRASPRPCGTFLPIRSRHDSGSANHPFDAAVDDEHGAGAAGGHPAIEGAAFQRDAAAGGLADGILLGMNRAHAVLGDRAVFMEHFLHQVADFVAMGQALGRADITGDQHLLVAYDHAAAAAAVAGGRFAPLYGPDSMKYSSQVGRICCFWVIMVKLLNC